MGAITFFRPKGLLGHGNGKNVTGCYSTRDKSGFNIFPGSSEKKMLKKRESQACGTLINMDNCTVVKIFLT